MAQNTVPEVSRTSIQRKDYGLATDNGFQGLGTVPFYGVGEQNVENMRLSSGVYEKMPEEDPNKRYLRIIMREAEILEARISEITKMEEESRVAQQGTDSGTTKFP